MSLRTLEQAQAILDGVGEVVGAEFVGLERAAGRVLSAAIQADRDFPPTDRSAMDGFAVRAADLPEPGRSLRVVGEVKAGDEAAPGTLQPGTAMRIFTGGVVPPGADSVVMVEETEEDPSREHATFGQAVREGQHVRKLGSDRRAGDRVLSAGSMIQPPEIASLATVGVTQVPVYRRLRVAVLSTGDEIVPVSEQPGLHQIRNSNAAMLVAQLEEMNVEALPLGIAGDTAGALDEKIAGGLSADALLITGGVSVGEYDLVGEALERNGMELLCHKVAVKPGKPILVGRAGSCVVFGLPGNPISAFAGFRIFAAPLLRRISGLTHWREESIPARLTEGFRNRPGRVTFRLARIETGESGVEARLVEATGSGDVLALSRANGFIVVPAERDSLECGETVETRRWPGADLR